MLPNNTHINIETYVRQRIERKTVTLFTANKVIPFIL